MKYSISYDNPLSHLVKVRFIIDDINKPETRILLPIWRPGRYEAANYAKNIVKVRARGKNESPLKITKITPSEWSIDTQGVSEISISYSYFAFRMDAGSSMLNEDQLYINFINCLLYDPERMDEACEVNLCVPVDYNIACGLRRIENTLFAKDYYQLADSPLIASNSIKHLEYEVNNVRFHIWIQGENNLDKEMLISDFTKFSDIQLRTMKSFPEKEYHFLFQILPYSFYHGVEHGNSTVITLGPSADMNTTNLYNELLGVSSHELFHAWNIVKIRPKELMPYRFNSIPVFPTGFVAEGFTTYYGDLFLARSGVFDQQQYFEELNKLFNRHFSNFGRLNSSVVEASIDLWFDGYQPSAPNKKSSIYVEGAMSALLLDLTIRKKTSGKNSLDDLMRLLWDEFGKQGVGYNQNDIEELAERIAGKDIRDFFLRFVTGVEDKQNYLNEMLTYVGCELEVVDSPNLIEKQFGIKIGQVEYVKNKVVLIAPDSIGEQYFSLQDEVMEINGKTLEDFDFGLNPALFHFKVRRNYKIVDFKIRSSDHSRLKRYGIKEINNKSKEQIAALSSWLNQ